MKVLIVDDADFKVENIIEYLSKLKIDYMVAETYIEAIIKLKKYHKELAGAILDLGFFFTETQPGIGKDYSKYMGIQLAEEINEKYPNMPILFNSDRQLLEEHKSEIIYFDHINPFYDNTEIITAFVECCREYYSKK